MIDKEEIIRALTTWFQPGDVFEIRALNALSAESMRPHTAAGYFEYDQIGKAAEEIGKLRHYTGVYVIINPVIPDLLARACNRLTRLDTTTSDADIVCRRWFLIDCDAVRKSGISSTDEEHQLALDKAKEIRSFLAEDGWPEPIMLDSGNGAQMLYRIDLPANDEGLCKSVLEKISLASSDKVNVDLTVFNPARLWRLPGTMNRKGDSIPTRPHRMAKILEIPETLSVVSMAQLKTVIGEHQAPPQPVVYDGSSVQGYHENNGFVIDEWIAKFAPDAGNPIPWNSAGGRKWIFKVCPFNSEHTNSSAGIFEHPDGALSFRCHHNSCNGNDWRKFRIMREPGCYDRKEPVYADVDISGILAQIAAKKEKPSQEQMLYATECIPYPDGIFDVPGFIGEVMKFTLEYAPYPNRPLAFAGAITLQAHLAARKVESPTGLRTNPYIVALAKSGVGKDFPRTVNQSVLEAIGKEEEIAENISSGQALEDELLVHPALIWQPDEFYAVLQEIARDTSGQKEVLVRYLLTLFTSARRKVATRVKVGRPKATVDCPNLTIFATTTPSGYFDSLTQRFLNDGMYGRTDIIIGESRGEGQVKQLPDIPKHIIAKAKAWSDFVPEGSGNLSLKAMVVQYTPEAEKLLQDVRSEEMKMYRKSEKEDDVDWKLSVWSRACENTMRYALIFACSIAEKPEDTIITAEAVQWARKFVWWQISNKIHMTDLHYHRTEFEKCSAFVIDIMARWHKTKGFDTPMPGWMFNRKTKQLAPNVLNAVQQSLVLQERLLVETKTKGTVYSLIPDKPKK